MSDAIEKIIRFHNWSNGISKVQSKLVKTATPLRLGVLSAAAISFTAFYDPISTHPDVVLTGIAARDPERARAHVSKYNLTAPCFAGEDVNNKVKVYDTYEELLDSPNIDAVYIPVPNGLHTKWTLAALAKGKHVLLEKPMASNAQEVNEIIEVAKSANKVVLEAFHWRFHPSCHLVKSLVTNQSEYGDVLSVYARMQIPDGTFAADDIRFRYDLAGGACMDLCYVFSAVGHYACKTKEDFSKSKVTITEATARKHSKDDKVDEQMKARFTLTPSASTSSEVLPVQCEIDADLVLPKLLGVIPKIWETPICVIEMTKAKIEFNGFPVAWLTNKVTITKKDAQGKLTGEKRTEKLYAGGPEWGKKECQTEKWWTTYRYQLEAFVDQVRRVNAGGNVDDDVEGPWVTLEEGRKMMEIIDAVYEKASLPKRGT